MRQACCGKLLRLWDRDLLRLLHGMLQEFFLRPMLRRPSDEFLRAEDCSERATYLLVLQGWIAQHPTDERLLPN